MKPASLLFALGGLVSGLVLGGCSGATSSAPAPAADEPSKTTSTTRAPVIAALKTHDGKVSITGGGDLRVRVTKDDGTVVADGATLDELRAKDEEAWMLVRSAVAQVAQGDGTYLDATYVEPAKPTLK